MAVDWAEELEKRDLGGLLTPENTAFATELALDASDLMSTQFPAAYSRIGTSRTVVKVVTDAVFRVLRDAGNEGFVRESDGVYSYSRSSGYQSPVIEFTRSEREWLGSFQQMFAFGSIRRGGVSG